jgi:hypothetical protein
MNAETKALIKAAKAVMNDANFMCDVHKAHTLHLAIEKIELEDEQLEKLCVCGHERFRHDPKADDTRASCLNFECDCHQFKEA